jgi:hypothetical protein
MKNWQIFGVFTFLIIGTVLISGCTQDNNKYCSDNFPGSYYDPSTKMCEHYTTPIAERTSSYSSVTTKPILTTSVTTKPILTTVSLNQALIVKTYEGTSEIVALGYKRGSEINQLVAKENMFNTKPDPGYEYIFINVRQKFIQGDKASSSLSVSSYNYKVYVNNVGYSKEYLVMPQSYKSFDSVSLLPGGQVEGWMAFIVPQNQPVKLAYESLGDPIGFIEIA